ncbi:MAG TPA: HlyD family secretion protein, partial [Verrucomicrobiales bacterium]|nr:HlyD family secretion protein [Verrucomicrobiales bacterium]
SARFSLLTSQNSLAYAEEELKQLKKMYAADDITEETEEIILQRATHAVNRAKHFLERSESTAANTLTATLPRE